jgi:uncharacterized protein YjiS (DUF1127 family)
MITTHSPALGGVPAADSTERPGLLKRLSDAYAKARLRSAERALAAHFAGMSDTRLADIGLSPVDIREVRRYGRIPASFWS